MLIDEIGRAKAVQYEASAYRSQAAELRHFLTQFVVPKRQADQDDRLARIPEVAFFFDDALADAMIDQNDQTRAFERRTTCSRGGPSCARPDAS